MAATDPDAIIGGNYGTMEAVHGGTVNVAGFGFFNASGGTVEADGFKSNVDFSDIYIGNDGTIAAKITASSGSMIPRSSAARWKPMAVRSLSAAVRP